MPYLLLFVLHVASLMLSADFVFVLYFHLDFVVKVAVVVFLVLERLDFHLCCCFVLVSSLVEAMLSVFVELLSLQVCD